MIKIKLNKKSTNNQTRTAGRRGFTLIELAISSSILAVIFGGITVFGVKTLQSFDRSQAIKETIENASYTIEKLNKTIRTSNTIDGGGNEIFVIDNISGESYCYFFEDDRLKMKTGASGATSCSNIEGDDFEVVGSDNNIKISGAFKIKETDRDANKRGLVRTSINIEYEASERQNEDKIIIQSAVSLRDYGLNSP